MKLKEIRQQKGMNQAELAKVLGITQASYSHYETNRRQPDIQLLVKLADYFKVTVDELIGHDVPYLINKSLLSEEQLAIIEKLKNLDTNQCNKILAYIDGLNDGKLKK